MAYIVNDIHCPASCPTSDVPTISAARNFEGGLATVHNMRADIPSGAGDIYAPATKGSGTPTLGGWERPGVGK